MNNRNVDPNLFFVAITIETMVHTAVTNPNLDYSVQADITRDKTFEHFYQLKDVDVHATIELEKAIKDSRDKYYQAKLNSPNALDKKTGFFNTALFSTSSDQKLIDIYGEDCVYVGKKPVTILYQVQIPNDLKQKIGDQKVFKLNENEKKKLKLVDALVGHFALHTTDEYTNRITRPASIDLVDHQRLTTKKKSRCKTLCTIL